MSNKLILLDLPHQIFKIFRELLNHLERNEVKINEKEFTQAALKIFSSLNTSEKNIILELDKLLLSEQTRKRSKKLKFDYPQK